MGRGQRSVKVATATPVTPQKKAQLKDAPSPVEPKQLQFEAEGQAEDPSGQKVGPPNREYTQIWRFAS